MDEYYDDPRYDSSQGRWVTYDADAGAVWEPLTVAAPLGEYVGTGDAGGQWVDYSAQERAAVAAQQEADRQAQLQAAAAYVASNPLPITGDQIDTKYGARDISNFNPIVNPGETVTGSTPTQLVDPTTNAPVYLSDANDPFSYTYENTGTPAIGGTLEQMAAMYRPVTQNGVFGTLGGDVLSSLKDPMFKNFAIAAAAMAAAAALAPAAAGSVGGSTAGGAGATAFPIDFGSTIITGGELAGGAGGMAAADFGSFIAADAAASAAGQGAFDLAASLGMPLDQAVTAGLINGAGNLTSAGASALMGVPAGASSLLPAAAAPTASTLGSLFSKGADVLAGPYGSLIKGGLTLGGLAAASALKPKTDTSGAGGSGMTAEELNAVVALMPSMVGQYTSQANSGGMGQPTGGYNPSVNTSLANLFPNFTLPTEGPFYGAGRFGENYAPTPLTSLV